MGCLPSKPKPSAGYRLGSVAGNGRPFSEAASQASAPAGRAPSGASAWQALPGGGGPRAAASSSPSVSASSSSTGPDRAAMLAAAERRAVDPGGGKLSRQLQERNSGKLPEQTTPADNLQVRWREEAGLTCAAF
ncbi:MAG: hypothetical protein BJ554DRAFT_7751 [Olpidium bornovanus]|uniref:Uncharacterized protein n=1 Tax=Olpidium bornovanus TaxID=278681 RepID=A0A8H8DIU8_9FUNG|nr:MAG: hypothetical protein BJ554DRAFT_7751 [Olpidium bornovanus]